MPVHTTERLNQLNRDASIHRGTSRGGLPRLLVSVRSPEEAREAWSGGCDILDVKEPSLGSLGMAEATVLAAIADDWKCVSAGGDTSTPLPLSIALGEVRDWSRRTPPALAAPFKFAKLGPSGLRSHSEWCDEWVSVRRRFETASGRRFDWIAVCYADADAAASPPAEEILRGAVETGCAGLLVDTWTKGNGGIFHWIADAALAELARESRRSGLLFGVAGGLSANDLPRVCSVGPDVIAIRTAACANGERTGNVRADAVAAFRRAMAECFVESRPRT